MADFNNENQNGVFGGYAFGENNEGTENTSFFGNTQQNINPENTNGVNAESASTNGIFGSFGVQQAGANTDAKIEFKPIDKQNAVTKQGLWSRVRSFLFQEIDLTAPIKVELTPYQQKVENEINEFLHKEISFKGIANLFGRK